MPGAGALVPGVNSKTCPVTSPTRSEGGWTIGLGVGVGVDLPPAASQAAIETNAASIDSGSALNRTMDQHPDRVAMVNQRSLIEPPLPLSL
jgi:hypothetical protein